MIEGPVLVRCGVRGMDVAPAGIDRPNTGHRHLPIDLPLDELDLDQPPPFTDQPRHIPFDPVVASEVITIHVR